MTYRMRRCWDKADVIVTNCHLILMVFYNKSPILDKKFAKVVLNVFNSYNNKKYFIDKMQNYNQIGRLHSKSESQALKEPVLKMLKDKNVDFTTIDGSIETYNFIIADVCKAVKRERKRNFNIERWGDDFG